MRNKKRQQIIELTKTGEMTPKLAQEMGVTYFICTNGDVIYWIDEANKGVGRKVLTRNGKYLTDGIILDSFGEYYRYIGEDDLMYLYKGDKQIACSEYIEVYTDKEGTYQVHNEEDKMYTLFIDEKEIATSPAWIEFHTSGDYIIDSNEGYYILFRNGKEEARGMEIELFDNGDYMVRVDNAWKLFRKSKEIITGQELWSYNNGDYEYQDKDGIIHLMREGKEIASGKSVYSYDNGDYDYEDQEGIHHLIRNGKEIASGTLISLHSDDSYTVFNGTKIWIKFDKNGNILKKGKRRIWENKLKWKYKGLNG